jgi:hypothetical protein
MKTATTNFLRVFPFTGTAFAIWAFFGPESYGRWLGTIVHAFRAASGI